MKFLLLLLWSSIYSLFSSSKSHFPFLSTKRISQSVVPSAKVQSRINPFIFPLKLMSTSFFSIKSTINHLQIHNNHRMAFAACYLHCNLFNDPFASRSFIWRHRKGWWWWELYGCCMRQFSWAFRGCNEMNVSWIYAAYNWEYFHQRTNGMPFGSSLAISKDYLRILSNE